MKSAYPERSERWSWWAIRWRGYSLSLLVAALLSALIWSEAMAQSRQEMNKRLIQLSENSKIGFWRSDFDALPEPKRVFRAIWEVEAEVNNGGFYQYFWNSSASSAPGVSDALRSIGAHATAAIAERAIAAVGNNLPRLDTDARRIMLAALPTTVEKELEALDEAFFQYPDDLTTLLYKYASKHRNQIGAPADF